MRKKGNKVGYPNQVRKFNKEKLNATQFLLFDRAYKPGDFEYRYTLFHEPGNISFYKLRGRQFNTVWYEDGHEFIDNVHQLAEALGYETTLAMLNDFHFWEVAIGLKDRYGVWPIYRFKWLEVNYGVKIFRLDRSKGIEAQELAEYLRERWMNSERLQRTA